MNHKEPVANIKYQYNLYDADDETKLQWLLWQRSLTSFASTIRQYTFIIPACTQDNYYSSETNAAMQHREIRVRIH